MDAGMIEQLIQGGAMGMFAAFLVWQHVQNTKRNDLLVERFQDQLAKINADYDSRIEAMRERYDAVIQSGRDELAAAQRNFSNIRETVQSDVSMKLDLILREIENRQR